MNTKIVLAIVAVALIAAALVGVSAAQFAGAQQQTQTALPYQTNPNCINAATGEQVCAYNGTCTNAYCNGTCTATGCNSTYCNETRAGYFWNSTGTAGENAQTGCGYGYGYGAQGQNQNQYCNQNTSCYTEQNQNAFRGGSGMMGQTGYGSGRCR